MSQPFLFYSERCPNSKQIIETLKALNKAALFKFILVENLARDQIPAFLKKVPTLYVPDTKDVIVGKDIFGYIAKPTAARKEIPTSQAAISQGGSSASAGDYSPWGFEGSGTIGEQYSLWDNPNGFSSQGGSNYTFLDSPITSQGGAGLVSNAEPSSENTIKSNKTGSNSDIAARIEAMSKQRESEFGGIKRN
jgi:glutaredoxin-related protein